MKQSKNCTLVGAALSSMWLKLAKWFLKRDWTLEERVELSTAILDNLSALPLRAIIQDSEQGILINGKLADLPTLQTLRESAHQALSNKALDFIGQQVEFIAVQRGVHQATKPEDLYFYRAALWFSQQLKEHLQILAQETTVE